ncbi:uncharacterized protein LOC119306169 [Triticum dicoccoides]|uniref:uncharacterized protein LOC119306169 n=1 Tax=Triticum dicoccoides TaxID=85692 RepID=UPI000E7919AB|nr:uncharacterized protein LOC119306169 [Triticum dicoccoides]
MSFSTGTSSSRGRKKDNVPEPQNSITVAQEFATRVVQARIQQRRRNNADSHFSGTKLGGRTTPKKMIVGGFVRSFKFEYIRGRTIAQGTMRIEDGSGDFDEVDVTAVILKPDEAEDGVVAQRIVEETQKLADYSHAIVEAYFSAYCEQIKRWVVVYEKFDGYFHENTDGFEFFKDAEKTELTESWMNTIRKFIEVLSFARVRKVFHHGLSKKSSYVVSSGAVKLINVARHTGRWLVTQDIKDLSKYFMEDEFFGAAASDDWRSLDCLLNSGAMTSDHWDTNVLGHPLLLGSADAKLGSYELAEIFMWSHMTGQERLEYSNAMYFLLDRYQGHKIKDYYINDPNRALYDRIYNLGAYNNSIYCDIVQFVRNLRLHHEEHTLALKLDSWSNEFIVEEITKLFRGVMSMAYSVAHVPRNEWKKLHKKHVTLPY